MKKFIYPTLIAAISFAAVSAHAQVVISDWTFETSAPTTVGPFTAELGTNPGQATAFHSGTIGTPTYSSPSGNGSAHSFSSNGWNVNDYYQFSASTTGFSGITVSFDQTSSNTGPRDFALLYSVNGGGFTQFGSTYTVLANAAPNNVWSATVNHPEFNFSFNLGAVTALNNAASVTFRLVNNSTVSANGAAVAATGTDRVDNFTISQTTPEPATMAALGLGAIALIRRRRSSK